MYLMVQLFLLDNITIHLDFLLEQEFFILGEVRKKEFNNLI